MRGQWGVSKKRQLPLLQKALSPRPVEFMVTGLFPERCHTINVAASARGQSLQHIPSRKLQGSWLRYKSFNMGLFGFVVLSLLYCTSPHFVLSTRFNTIIQPCESWRKAPEGFDSAAREPQRDDRFGQGQKGTRLSPECEVSAFD